MRHKPQKCNLIWAFEFRIKRVSNKRLFNFSVKYKALYFWAGSFFPIFNLTFLWSNICFENHEELNREKVYGLFRNLVSFSHIHFFLLFFPELLGNYSSTQTGWGAAQCHLPPSSSGDYDVPLEQFMALRCRQICIKQPKEKDNAWALGEHAALSWAFCCW